MSVIHGIDDSQINLDLSRMNESIRSDGQMVQAAILFVASLPMAIMGLAFLSSYPDEIWYVGFLFLASGALLLYSGISTVRKVKGKQKENAVKTIEMLSKETITSCVANPLSQTSSPINDWMVSWKLTSQQWKEFRKAEHESRKSETVVLILIGTFFFGWFIQATQDESWALSLMIGFVFSCLFFGLKMWLSKGNLSVSKGVDVELLIDREKIMINGKLFYFSSDERRLTKVEQIEKSSVKMLEFTYAWTTRKGQTNDSIMIPVPSGKQDEAASIINRLKI